MRTRPCGGPAAALLAILVVVAPRAGFASPAGQLRDTPVSRVTTEDYERMARAMPRWVEAVGAHVPGVVDPPARDVSGWSGFDLEAVIKCVGVVFDQGNRHYPFAPKKDALAAIVRRGAMLHADIALIVPADPAHVPSPLPSSREQRVVVLFRDARQNATYYAGIHLEVGRALVDALRRTEWRDDALTSLWYAATTAALLRKANLADAEPHVDRGVQLLQRDPWLLFYAGALHEEYAGPRSQHMVDALALPTGFQPTVRSTELELLRAEKLLTRSLRADPDGHEVRLHHARVAGLLGRHSEAASELRLVSGAIDDRVLLYYAALFLGQEEAALGHRAAAREAFERAAVFCPTAQSPLVALSELARRSGDRLAAQSALRRLFALPRSVTDREDPWWHYYRSYTTGADVLVGRLRALFRGGTQ